MTFIESTYSERQVHAPRILALDGIRGFAMILVLVWHFVACQVQAAPGSSAAYALKIFSYSWAGVDLFFVLSGFLIGGILLDHRSSASYFIPFYVRRACRIFPLYYFVYIFFVAGCAYPAWQIGGGGYRWLFGASLPAWSYPLHLQNFLMAETGSHGPNWMGVSWSLAVEEQFYLLLPFIVRFFSRTSVGWISMVLVLSGPLIRALFLMWHPHGQIASYVLLPARWDAMFLGVLGALAVRSVKAESTLRNHLLSIRVAIIFSSVLLAVLCLAGQGTGSWGMCLLGHSLLALMSLCIILLTTLSPGGWAIRFFRHAFLVWVGNISYGLYLFHQPIAGLLHGYVLNQPPQIRNTEDASVTLLALVVTFGLAVFSSGYIETPMVKLGHSFRYTTGNLLQFRSSR